MTATNQNTLVRMFPTNGGPGLTFSLLGDATYNPAAGGQGGWQIIDRPRLVAATQWYDRSPMAIVGKVMLDSSVIYGAPGQSIEQQCRLLDSWQDKVPGTNQPPVFFISGPVAGTQRQWVLYTFTFNEAIRDSQAQFRTQQMIDLTLYEYNSPLQTTLNNPSPAAQATFLANNQANGSGGYYAYTVVQGDTLESIAARLLNNYSEWLAIAALNGIRDPNNIFPGQVLSIPNS